MKRESGERPELSP